MYLCVSLSLLILSNHLTKNGNGTFYHMMEKQRARESSTPTSNDNNKGKTNCRKRTITFLFVYNTKMWFVIFVVTTFGAKFSNIYYYIYAWIQCACLLTCDTVIWSYLTFLAGQRKRYEEKRESFGFAAENECRNVITFHYTQKWNPSLLQGLNKKGHPTFFSWIRNQF